MSQTGRRAPEAGVSVEATTSGSATVSGTASAGGETADAGATVDASDGQVGVSTGGSAGGQSGGAEVNVGQDGVSGSATLPGGTTVTTPGGGVTLP